MRFLNGYRMRLAVVAFVTAVVIGSGSAKADFTFGEPTNLDSPINSPSLEASPFISSDGLQLYFLSDREGGIGGMDLWMVTRLTTNDQWGSLVNLGPTINSSANEYGPNLSVDGLTLYFASKRPDGLGDIDIWLTTRTTVNDPCAEAVNLGSTINSANNDGGPNISPDGLTLFFYSRRPGGLGRIDIWVATRETIEGEWGIPINLGPMVNSSAEDTSPYISNDGLTLYFASEHIAGQGSYDIWQVPILPVVDLNNDGIVDGADLSIIVNHWGTDEPLCDIGPMPWGDGIVDVQDLIVLAEHLFEEFPPADPVE